MTVWKHYSENVAPGESVRDLLVKYGREGWEPWHIEGPNADGWRTIFFKKPAE